MVTAEFWNIVRTQPDHHSVIEKGPRVQVEILVAVMGCSLLSASVSANGGTMPGLNRRSYRADDRTTLHHGTAKPKAKATVEIAMTDPVKAAMDRFDAATQAAVVEILVPVLADRDQRITDLFEELRLERIRSDQQDRLHARVDRARERQIEELRQENEAQEKHIEYLRGELAKSQSMDRLASAIVGAAREAK